MLHAGGSVVSCSGHDVVGTGFDVTADHIVDFIGLSPPGSSPAGVHPCGRRHAGSDQRPAASQRPSPPRLPQPPPLQAPGRGHVRRESTHYAGP